MAYVVTFHWGWMLAALVLGLAMGWVAVVQRGEGLSASAFRWVAAVVAVALVVALTRLLPGRFGYWLDLALALLAVYLAGCIVGSLMRGALIARYHASKAAEPPAS